MRLYMILLGCKPQGRLIEQHDIFFGVGNSLAALVAPIEAFWPGAKIHIDSWREVTAVDNYRVTVVAKSDAVANEGQLYFFNLGGYQPNDLEEYHYKVLTVADTLADATKKAKASAFYKHFGFKGANSHIDDKYGIDVDDVYKVADILDPTTKAQYTLQITKSEIPLTDDILHIGYLPLGKLKV